MANRKPSTQELYRAAMNAFAAAEALAILKPLPGTKLWNDWQMLVQAAIKANGEYIRSLRAPP